MRRVGASESRPGAHPKVRHGADRGARARRPQTSGANLPLSGDHLQHQRQLHRHHQCPCPTPPPAPYMVGPVSRPAPQGSPRRLSPPGWFALFRAQAMTGTRPMGERSRGNPCGGRHSSGQTRRPGHCSSRRTLGVYLLNHGASTYLAPMVEVPGIEPGSDDEDWSILRAQPQLVRSRLPCISWLVRERSPVTVTVPQIPVTGIWQLVIFTTPVTTAMTTVDRRTSFSALAYAARAKSARLLSAFIGPGDGFVRSPRLLSPLLSSQRSPSKPVTPLFSCVVRVPRGSDTCTTLARLGPFPQRMHSPAGTPDAGSQAAGAGCPNR